MGRRLASGSDPERPDARADREAEPVAPPPRAPERVLALQTAAGNQAVSRLLRQVATLPGLEPPDPELAFSHEYQGGRPKRVTRENLTSWIVRQLEGGGSERTLLVRMRHEHLFSGSDEALAHWIRVAREELLPLARARRAELAEQAHRLREEERRREAAAEVQRFRSRSFSGEYSLGSGFFKTRYEPAQGVFTATVPVSFSFAGGDDRAWATRFVEQVQRFWSRHELLCTRPGWESLKAIVTVKVEEVKSSRRGDGSFLVDVRHGFAGSNVRKGFATLDYKDLDAGSGGASVAVHEFGHMLGLDDEYHEAGKPALAGHSELVKQEFGYDVPRLRDRDDRFRDSVMFGGGKRLVLAEHGVVFLDAMARLTGIPDWDVRIWS